MSLFARERRVAQLNTLAELIEANGRSPRSKSVSVTTERALKVAAFWRSVFLQANVISTLPIGQFVTEGGRRREVAESPVVSAPSAIVSRREWIAQQVVSFYLRGNAYGVHTQLGANGWPAKCEIVHPDAVEVRQDDMLAPPTYRFNRRDVDRSRMYHVAVHNVPGSAVGLSPLTYGARTLGAAIAASDYELEMLAGGGHPTSILSTESKIDPDDAAEAKKRFKEATAADNLAVLGLGWKYDRVQITPQEMSLIDSRNVSAIDVCMFLGMPPEYLGLAPRGSSLTYANREQRAIDLWLLTLQPIIVAIETAWSSMLPRRQYVKFNIDALLRSDANTRSQILDRQIRNGTRSRDEARAYDDLAPIPDGSGGEFLWPPYRTTLIASDESTGAA